MTCQSARPRGGSSSRVATTTAVPSTTAAAAARPAVLSSLPPHILLTSSDLAPLLLLSPKSPLTGPVPTLTGHIRPSPAPRLPLHNRYCGCSTAFLLGLFGAAAPFEALRILIWDVEHSHRGGNCCACRGTNEETPAFGILRLVQVRAAAHPTCLRAHARVQRISGL